MKDPSATETATSTTASITSAVPVAAATTAAPVLEEGDFREQKRRKRVKSSDSDKPGFD
jgi:hypothetical protein